MATAPLDIYETTLGQELYDTSPAQAIVARGRCVKMLGAAEVFRWPLLAEWDALASLASEPNSFAESWYIAAGVKAFDRADSLRFATYFTAGKLRGIIPLTISNEYGRMPVRHVENWQHANSFLGTPLVEPGYEREFWQALIAQLDRIEWAVGFLHIRGLIEGGAMHQALCEASEASTRSCEVVLREPRPIRVSAAPIDPVDVLDGKRLSECRRKRRRLEELGEVTFATFGPQDDGDAWIDRLLKLEASGWKGRAGSALSSDEATDAFGRTVLEAAHLRGQLHGLSLELDGKPIAMLSNLVSGEGAFGFKAAFDEDFARFSPGQLLQLEALARDIPGGAKWHDSCANADHPVASLWSDSRRIVRVTIPLAGLARRMTHAGVRTLEKLSAQRRALMEAMK